MFICPKCKTEIKSLEHCDCGFIVPVVNNIYQFTDMPNLVLDSNNDKYIGYEHIGAYYSGYDGNPKLTDDDILKATTIAKELGNENNNITMLDIGCGDGLWTIPLLSVGLKVVSGDISNKMMSILQDRASKLGISTHNLTLSRMNALNLPMKNDSIDGVIAHSMLHLNSNPQKIISEISRVLKKGGKYFCFEDHPGGSGQPDPFDNREFYKRENHFHYYYWKILNEKGIKETRYSWKFDRDALCNDLFVNKKEVLINIPQKVIESPLSKFVLRLSGRGFSDQSAVPDDLHKVAFDDTVIAMKKIYGDDYDKIICKELPSDVNMTIYIK